VEAEPVPDPLHPGIDVLYLRGSTAVKVIHLRTGLEVESRTGSTQLANRTTALRQMGELLEDMGESDGAD
jgi:protein subunit release factor A